MNIIQIYRGLKATIPILKNGQFGYCVDKNELYVGNDNVNLVPNDSYFTKESEYLKHKTDVNKEKHIYIDTDTNKISIKDGRILVSEDTLDRKQIYEVLIDKTKWDAVTDEDILNTSITFTVDAISGTKEYIISPKDTDVENHNLEYYKEFGKYSKIVVDTNKIMIWVNSRPQENLTLKILEF